MLKCANLNYYNNSRFNFNTFVLAICFFSTWQNNLHVCPVRRLLNVNLICKCQIVNYSHYHTSCQSDIYQVSIYTGEHLPASNYPTWAWTSNSNFSLIKCPGLAALYSLRNTTYYIRKGFHPNTHWMSLPYSSTSSKHREQVLWFSNLELYTKQTYLSV